MATRKGFFLLISFLLSLTLPFSIATEVFFEERFDDGWEDRWVISEWKRSENLKGQWNHTAGKWHADPQDKGIQTTQDFKYHAISAEFPGFSNKDRTLVFQFSVKHEQKLNCGGGYLKLINGTMDQEQFGGDTPYSIMFGPDICGEKSRRVHAIFSHNGENHNLKRIISFQLDQLTHVYTFIIRPDASYSIIIDNEEKQSGNIFKDWDLLPPRNILDPHANKPEDWEDKEYIPDPEHKKPEGYDDIPAHIPDPRAQKPGDWNEEEKGEWKAPKVKNPEYKGPWRQKKIKNPNYRGKWKVPMIENPEFEDDPHAYVYQNIRYIGIELWQVRAGTLFDNILICDDAEYARKVAEETWGEMKDAEKAAFEKAQRILEEEETRLYGKRVEEDDEEELDVEEKDWEAKLREEDEGGHDEL